MKYNHKEIEPKWQKYWDENKTYQTENTSDKPKFYALDMFPFPSGAGLHVGHPEGYTATDIISRYKRLKGFNVLHPMGWDSFGLPAENYAVKTGTHPQETTEANIQVFKRQLKSLGFSYDWDREIATSRIEMYRWTQELFVHLYNKGLAYEASVEVNWCPELKTVLANEEVVDGKSEVGGHPVIRKKMNQWMLKITEYADRLIDDLDGLDWPESIKEMQRNWIGRSYGASVSFEVDGFNDKIEVFTTRPDTLFGATYMVLAPDHALVEKITTKDQMDQIKAYQEKTALKSDLERTELNKEKSGVFTGCFAINPVNGKKIPIWISDYVLSSYGTGAIMSVPAHDQRDWEFAKKFDLEIIPVLKGGDINEAAFTEDGPHINSDFLDGLGKEEAIQKMISWLDEKKIGKSKINYKLRDWIFSRQRYWGEPIPVLKYEDGSVRCLDPDELPVALPEVEKYEPSGTGESPLSTIDEWVNVTCPKTNKPAKREANTMPQWAGSCWYYLRYIDPHNDQEPFNKELVDSWLPVDLYVGGVEHATLHLLYARFWHKVFYDLGLVSSIEPFQKLVNQGMILGEDGEKMSKSRGNVINPDTIVDEFGADSLRLYEMFMGPLEKVKPWQTSGVKGVNSFLKKAYEFLTEPENIKEDQSENLTKELHKMIKGVTEDTENMRFNTAISKMMIFMNAVYKEKQISKTAAKNFTIILSAYAPHAAEDIWESLGEKSSVALKTWPSFDADLAKDDLITIGIQINGKTKATIDVDPEISKEDFLAQAKEASAKFLEGKNIIKEIYVPKRICNFVVK
jgi:leucyl-tRNA synthetase